MARQITLPSQAPGCTLQIVHDNMGLPTTCVYPYSISLYARAASSKTAEIVQLVYAPADALEISEVTTGRFTLWARADGNMHVCFEITRETAQAIAEFAGMALSPKQAAA